MVRVLLGLLALFFCASQALAVPAAPSSLVLPPTPDVDGVYKLAWYPVSGCNYVLQESKDGGAWATIYSGSNTYIYPPKRALGSYTYQVKAVNSTGSSLWKPGARAVVVGATTAQTTAPTYLNVPAATSTSATKITFGGAALSASYVLEQSKDGGAFAAVYTGSNGYYYTVGLVDGSSYAYRVKAKVAGYADSNYYPASGSATLAVAFPQGSAACLVCHTSVSPDWTASAHGNPNQQPGPGVCDNCHNVANVAGATVAQITCEACHGPAVANHADAGVVYALGAAVASCAKCHDSHVSASNSIASDVATSGGHAANSCGTCHNAHTLAVTACTDCHNGPNGALARHGVVEQSCNACHATHSLATSGTFDHATLVDANNTTCGSCHVDVGNAYTTSQHKTKQGKNTWYNDHLGNTDPLLELQTGFGNYTTVAYDALPCKNCHNGVDNGPWDSNPAVGVNTQVWPGASCIECHGNPTTYGVQSTSVTAEVTKNTCYGCHSRQKKEAAPTASGGAGLTDVHYTAGMGCNDCHSTTDFHGTGKQTSSQLEWGTISAQCENCHGDGKAQGPLSNIAEHAQHLNNVACSTCHAESMVTCNNCHFDNEAGGTGITKLKFASGFFGGTKASGKSWRFLVNRVMPDGSTKVYPGSMQSLYTDVYAKNSSGSGTIAGEGDDIGWSHAGIAPYYSHSITRVNALKCADCHGTQNAIDLANGQPIRVITWLGSDTDTVAPTALGTMLKGPSGVIPVPENPKGKLLMDFVDLVDPDAAINATNDNIVSYRKLAKRDGPDSIHMPEAYVKPLTALQIQKLALTPHLIASYTTDNAAIAAAVANPDTGATACSQCHYAVDDLNAVAHYEGLAFHYAQYVISPASQPVVCANCHAGNDVAAHAVIADQFAASAHGNVEGDAWRQYDWRSASRISCQRCHTGNGFVAKLGNETNTSNAFAATDILKPGEVLNCSTCHTDLAAGTLRSAPEAFTIGSVSYNVVGASTLCARCHGGRATGAAIAADTDEDGVRAFISPHYLSAAATLFNEGYEFAGQSYDSLGTNKTLGATSQGPCVTCHMANGNHSMAAAIPADGVTKKAAIQAGLVNLKTALEAKGIHYSDVHPFFYTAPFVANTSRDGLEGTYNAAFINWAGVYGSGSWKDVMGAAFNYQLLLNDPGAYAHNYEYASKLIADSIDFLNDGAVNGN